MARNDLYSLRLVVGRAIRASGRRLRELEDEIGVRHGNLRRLMEGEAEIRISHLIALARALRVSPADFLAAGCPKANRMAKHRLRQWIGADGPEVAEEEPAPAPFPTTAAELESVVQAAVERALAGWSAEGGAAARGPTPVVPVLAASANDSPS
jgi:transcriptional regulator with XRE-family HTH domain